MPIAKILYAFFTVFAVHFLGPKNHLLEKTAAKTAKTLDTGCPRVLWKRGPHVRVGCPTREPVASLHPGTVAAASKETGGAKPCKATKAP